MGGTVVMSWAVCVQGRIVEVHELMKAGLEACALDGPPPPLPNSPPNFCCLPSSHPTTPTPETLCRSLHQAL